MRYKLGTASAVGLFLEEAPHRGTAVLWESCGLTRTGQLNLNGAEADFTAEDIVGPGCAPPGLQLDRTHRLRLLLRRNMFEVYLDDFYVQTFNTSRIPGSTGAVPRRVGLVVQNGRAVIEEACCVGDDPGLRRSFKSPRDQSRGCRRTGSSTKLAAPRPWWTAWVALRKSSGRAQAISSTKVCGLRS